MTPNYYVWAIEYLASMTEDLNADETINYLRDIAHQGAKGRERLKTNILFYTRRLFRDNYQDILRALADMPYEKVIPALHHDFKEEAVCCVLETVSEIMADALEKELKKFIKTC